MIYMVCFYSFRFHFFCRHSYFIKMTKEIEQGASSSSSKTIVSVGETSAGPEPAKPDLPIFQ